MGRRAAKITHDEVVRLIRGVQTTGLDIGSISFDGQSVRIVIGGESGDNVPQAGGHAENDDGLIREPKL